jgi:ubiquinone/menaquinone biosynthesis C-methylase UbiE
MSFDYWKQNWEKLGAEDPLWAILTVPDKKGGRWDPEAFFATGREEIAGVMNKLLALGIKPSGGRALDFGCGVGRLSQALAAGFDEVHGVDVSAPMVERANGFNRHPDRCHYHVNTRPDLQLFPPGHFDFIYSNIVLQHIEPRFSLIYIREFFRVIKPGGTVVFQVLKPTLRRGLFPQFAVDAYRKLKHGNKPLIGMFGISDPQLRATLRDAGARVLSLTSQLSPDLGWRWISRSVVATKDA